MEIEIPAWLYEMLLNEAAETGSTIEEIVEFACSFSKNKPPLEAVE